MKKLFVLLVIALSAIGASGQGVYMVQEGDKFTQGDVITSVSNITLTLSTDGGTFKDGKNNRIGQILILRHIHQGVIMEK